MKLNRLFLLAAMGLGLFACNDKEHRKKELRMWDFH